MRGTWQSTAINPKQSSQQIEQSGIEMQNGNNGKHNVKGDKQDIEHVQGGERRQTEQPMNNYILAGDNPSNTTNKSHTKYQSNFHKISNNFKRYEPNSHAEKITQKGNNDGQGVLEIISCKVKILAIILSLIKSLSRLLIILCNHFL